MLKRLFGSVIDVRKGEVALTALMFFYYYLLLVTYYFLKPARDSLFLVKLGAEQLPIVFMLIAVIVVPVITLYSRASRRLKLNKLINVTTLVLIVNLVLLRFLLEFTHSAVFYTFYIWVSIYGALSTAQFWLLANGIFDATQAKRLFVLFGLGGIIGAFTGGEVTSIFVNVFNISTENLLFFCIALLAVCTLLVNAIWRIKQKSESPMPVAKRGRSQPKESYAEIFRTIKGSRHLLLIVGIIAMTMATASFVDYQFKTISVQSFTTKPELTSFLGKFYGRLSLISFLFQLLISYRFLKWAGVGGAILLLPLGLLTGSIWLLFAPGLLAAIMLRGADGVFKYSIDKTGRELLFLPVPLEVKKRTKVFIDIFVDRWFRGFAGGILLILVSVVGLDVRQLSFVVLGLILVWLSLVWMMRREYVNAFRLALERREIDLDDIRINIAESATLNSLRTALASNNDRQIVYALGMLDGVQAAEIVGAVRPLLRHKASDVRAGAVRLLRTLDTDDLKPDMQKLLQDPAPEIRRDAMHYLTRCDSSQGVAMLKRYLEDADLNTRTAALACIAEYGTAPEKDLVNDDLIKSLVAQTGEVGTAVRTEVARALGAIGKPFSRAHLESLVDDPSHVVVGEAIRSIGQLGDRESVALLVERLRDNRYRRTAREALALYGDRIVGTLSDYVIDPAVDFTLRSNVCRVLGQIPSQHSIDALVSLLDAVEPQMRFFVIKALNTLRAKYPELRFSHDGVNSVLVDETEAYYAMLQMLRVNGVAEKPKAKLLERALEEKTNQNLERIFRLLGLNYPQQDIYGAYLGLVGTSKQLRASAVEFLDNVLKKEIKKYLFPIVDNITDDYKIKRGQELFGLEFSDREAVLSYLMQGDDPWLKACAIYNVDGTSSPEIRDLVDKAMDDPNPVIQETSRLVARASAS